MKKLYITILTLCLMFVGCAYGTRIQREAFNVSPVYCHGDECFHIYKKASILLFGNTFSDGQYKILVEETTIEDGEEEVEKYIQTINVNGDIVTVKIDDDIVCQYDQKNRKMINISDNSDTFDEEPSERAKKLTNKLLGMASPIYASSGDIVSITKGIYTTEISIANEFNMKSKYFVHGATMYEGSEYVLVETKGTIKFRINGHQVLMTQEGYVLLDDSVASPIRSVLDITLTSDDSCFSSKTITTQKEI